MSSTFTDNFAAVESQVLQRIDQELMHIGSFIVSAMQGYAPVDTGALRTGIHDIFDPASHSVTIYSPARYSVWQEFGTRFIRPHPYIRPAIFDASKRWSFDVTLFLHPPAQKSEPLRATTSGFKLPKHQRLTPAQEAHVRKHLIPTSRKFAAKFKRRGIKFRVVGPK